MLGNLPHPADVASPSMGSDGVSKVLAVLKPNEFLEQRGDTLTEVF